MGNSPLSLYPGSEEGVYLLVLWVFIAVVNSTFVEMFAYLSWNSPYCIFLKTFQNIHHTLSKSSLLLVSTPIGFSCPSTIIEIGYCYIL